MVLKKHSSNSFHLFGPRTVNSSKSSSHQKSSSRHATGSSMSSEMHHPVHVSPYGPPAQGNFNGSGQPYPQPEQYHDDEKMQTSNQHPQYSYDIRLRVPQDEIMHSYPPPPGSSQGSQLPPMNMAAPEQDNGDYAAQSIEMDKTGQIAPFGAKPRVTATLWEDEGTVCFQVDVKGTCVARREDNHMVNGTKLLNVVGMTRGRRDGILKAEKEKHVVKIGPMHLKGVWIPFERALEFANREKITETLYPLFVHNISALLHHPVNVSGNYTAAAMIPRGPELPQRYMTEPNDQDSMESGRSSVPAGQRYGQY
ncbi:hypothetical protein VTL71DRAFT_4577 [Oculimacula yallundae]|uniref:HTH APSES-type domain-containing protein n=1 Tax=Oculimacula yallundae TaxID=86028 RepID=A0ABR4C2G0_9HELO